MIELPLFNELLCIGKFMLLISDDGKIKGLSWVLCSCGKTKSNYTVSHRWSVWTLTISTALLAPCTLLRQYNLNMSDSLFGEQREHVCWEVQRKRLSLLKDHEGWGQLCTHEYTCLNLLQTTGTGDEFWCHNLGISCHLICCTMSTFQSIRACGSWRSYITPVQFVHDSKALAHLIWFWVTLFCPRSP